MEDPGIKSQAVINDHNEPDINWGTQDKKKKGASAQWATNTSLSAELPKRKGTCSASRFFSFPLHLSFLAIFSVYAPAELGSQCLQVLVSSPSLTPLVYSLPACPHPDFTTNAFRTCSPVLTWRHQLWTQGTECTSEWLLAVLTPSLIFWWLISSRVSLCYANNLLTRCDVSRYY